MPDGAAGVPVGVRQRVDDEPAVGRELRVEDAGQFGNVEKRHWFVQLTGATRVGRTLRLRAGLGRGFGPRGSARLRDDRGERHAARDHTRGTNDETGRSSE